VDEGINYVGPDALPEEWISRVKPELAPGERLIWAGEAKVKHGLSGRAVATLWASGFGTIALFAFMALFGSFGAALAVAEGPLATIGVGSSAMAFLIVIGLIANALGKAADQPQMPANLYALTDSRAITWSPSGAGVTVRSVRRGDVKSVHRVEYADGSGCVYFNTPTPNTYGVPSGFIDVNDARRVEALVRLHLIADSPTT
jgi:hypothetical protein